MASRGKSISRPTAHTDGNNQREHLPQSLSRRISVASSSSSNSKIPAYKSSFFSRSKTSKPSQAEAEATRLRSETPYQRVDGHSATLAGSTSRSEPVAKTQLHGLQAHGFGIAATVSQDSSNVSSTEKRYRNVLRRKASSNDQHAQYARTESSASSYEPGRQYDTTSSPDQFRDPFSGSVLGVALPAVSSSTSYLPSRGGANSVQATSSSRMATFNPHSGSQILVSQNLPPPTPSFAHSSGSSTRRSESPGSFSRTSTPTSMSSQSPGIPLPARSPLKIRQVSPAGSRPPPTRRRGNLLLEEDSGFSRNRGLPAVRESRTSSSSSSTVRGAERVEGVQLHASGRRLSPPPPTPQQSTKKFQYSQNRAQSSKQSLEPRVNSSQGPEGLNRTTETLEQVDSKAQPSRLRGPPPRPSREGTPKLDDSTAPSPIIQSNLSRIFTTGHKRRESLDKSIPSKEARLETTSASRSMINRSPSNISSFSGKVSRLPPPSLVSKESARPRPAETAQPRGIPQLEINTGSGRTKDSSLPENTSSKPSTRFGLFTRRTKSPLDAATTESSERALKKGPTAGTGHEGYGKYAKRGRSGSVGTSVSRGRSTSTGGTSNSLARTSTSRKSSITSRGEPDIDDFLLERLTPVIISGGGGISENRNSGADIYRVTSEEGSIGRSSNDGLETQRKIAFTQTHLPKLTSAMRSENAKLARRGSRVLADGEDLLPPFVGKRDKSEEASSERPTLAARRSLHRSQLFKEAEPMKLPAPINTGALAPAPAINSFDTMLSSALRADSTHGFHDDISEGNWFKSRKTEKRIRSPRRWNFFQRANATSKREDGPKIQNQEIKIREMPVTIARLPESRRIAHYAMLDSNDQDSSSSTGNLISDSAPPTHNSSLVSVAPEPETDMHKQSHKHSMLLPSPPNFPAEFSVNRGPSSPIVISRQPEIAMLSPRAVEEPPKPRQPRLQQVGRIPRVISNRDRLHKPAPQSFSRPFTRAAALATEAQTFPSHFEDVNDIARPILGIQTELIPSHPWGNQESAKPASALVIANERFEPPLREEFFTFPPRKGSDVSGSSSSGVLSFSATTAIAPQSNTAPGEDEVWNEYDEFLDIVEPRKPAIKEALVEEKSKSRNTRLAPAPLLIRKDSTATGSTVDLHDPEPVTSKRVAPTADLPIPPRLSNLLSPLRSSDLVSTPLSFSDFFAGYGDRNRASNASKRQSGSSKSRYSSRSALSRADSQYSGDGDNKRKNTEIVPEMTETRPGAQSNLRFSALMTSRWLSFGRVLFSPAHTEIQSNRQDRVLVLDGLGNDDWSFYCALTYPNATVYNLSPFQGISKTSTMMQEAGGYQSPTNHRQIYHTSIAHPFPFPKGFFTAAVFRFPVASSEAACFNAISECKRVLRSGGFLEMSILDLDMVNMGNRARRAVRTLKVKMQIAEPEVSLKPASDNIQKMLGRRGFENLNRCMVNVPIAGHISDSRAGSFDEKDMSLGDMLKDPSQQGDEDITKMVAKVGRWWYTRCYEMSVLPHDDSERSIWSDKALLKECEKKETGLKLLICYAQKPLSTKRRTVSM